MNDARKQDWTTVVAGFGSPHGDDLAGWRVAAMLQRRPSVPARVIAIHEPTQLIDALHGCQRLIIVDACHLGGVAGAITRLVWPDPRIAVAHHRSTHGMGVPESLKLAERLGELPQTVEIFGIEVADCSPGRDLTAEVLRAVDEVEATILKALREAVHA